jgi:feruloyl-CoA synthase
MQTKVRDVCLGTLGVTQEKRPDGSILVRSTVPVPPHPDTMLDRLEHWARVAPERTFLAKRDRGGDWRRVSYAEMHTAVRSIASALVQRQLSPKRPIMLLSNNDIEHAQLALAAMYIGVPFSAISPAYALISSDYGKLRHIAELLKPQLVFANDAGKFAKAIEACFDSGVEVVATRGSLPGRNSTPVATLLATPIGGAVDVARAKVGPDTVAKVLFTSGSTGMPKGVITTQRMLTSNQAIMGHWLSFAVDEPPILLDWLPWNHTFGGNHNFGLVLYNGGTLYIDDGKPTPQGFAESLRNLREVTPSIYFNVPKGYEELIAALRQDRVLREKFFKGVKLTFYAAAALPKHLADELDQLAIDTIGERILMVNGFGATETAPSVLGTNLATSQPGNIGLPLPGVTIKLVPSGDKLEARVHSPSLMPGYWQDAENTAKGFDEEGYYKFGDAFRFADAADPAKGFYFDGRVTEDFKLLTGTWVSVGPLRARIIAAFAPLVRDVVITGHDRNEIGGLVFPDLEACRSLLPEADCKQPDHAVLASTPVRTAFTRGLAMMAKEGGGSSTRVVRLLLLDEPPSIDANEITDKGSLNQRAVLARRAALVAELYTTPPSARVLTAK